MAPPYGTAVVQVHEDAVRLPIAALPAEQVRPLLGASPWKRLLDLALVTLSAPASLMLMALIAMAVRFVDGGPVLFKQERIGFRGKKFLIWKVRTMVPDAEDMLSQYLDDNPAAGAEWRATQKLQVDPRATRLGRFLRASSLDELPQLWNVLTGDMSLVGPRPLVEGEGRRYGSHYRYYLTTRPGLTGLWQVSGRNDTTYEERVAMDVRYIQSWSVLTDLLLILKTVGVVLRRSGAY